MSELLLQLTPAPDAHCQAVGITVLTGCIANVLPALITNPAVTGSAFAVVSVLQAGVTAAIIGGNGELHDAGCVESVFDGRTHTHAHKPKARCGSLQLQHRSMACPL